jgi:phosphohistidine swiveling domain-containing protein
MSSPNVTVDPVPAPLPTPANFPVSWEQSEDVRLLWTHDRLHWPAPIMPIDGWSIFQAYQEGISSAAEFYGLPLRCRARRLNTYLYFALTPLPAPPAELEAKESPEGTPAQEKLTVMMARLGDAWSGEFLPEIKAHLAFWQGFDLQHAALPALLAHLEETVARHRRLYHIHMVLWFAFMTAISLFEEAYCDLFGDADALEAHRLLQGFDNKTVEAGRALWRLSRRALAHAEVRRILEEQAAADVPAMLQASAQGQAFLKELDAYLDEYGRGILKWELAYPSPREDPTPVIKTLKDYITQPDRDLEAEREALAAERERLVAQTRQRLQGYPEPAVAQFEFLLRAAQEGVVLTEDHGFWIDFLGMYEVRRVFLEFGRRFAAAGVVEVPEEVFYLVPAEVRETAAMLPRLDRRRLIAGRRAELAYFRTIVPPPVLGTVPAGPPPADPLSCAVAKFFGEPARAPAEPGTLQGNAGSPGTARGPARVVRSLADAARLQPGDVLVAETTAPPWTPLFATAVAVVTDTGGILSHCAVVAREYGIPAVVGAGAATTTIADGQWVEVDGTRGMVRLAAPA